MAKKPQKNSVHLESSTLSGCVRSSLPCCMAHSFSKTLIQFQQNYLYPLLMATDTAARQPPTSPQECTVVNICSWLWSLKWVSQAVLLSGLGRGDLSWAHTWVQWAMGWLAGAHTTLFCLCLVLQQASRACGCDRSMQGPLNHRLGAGNRRFHHILLARASPKANPDSKGRKTNSTSSMERLPGHIIRRRKPRERWNMGSFYSQLTTLIWTYRKRLSYFLANVLGFFEVALSGCRSVTLGIAVGNSWHVLSLLLAECSQLLSLVPWLWDRSVHLLLTMPRPKCQQPTSSISLKKFLWSTATARKA